MPLSLAPIVASDAALGRWLGAGFGVMLLVMGGLGLRDYLRRYHRRPPSDRTPE
jgi:hypothetical protein